MTANQNKQTANLDDMVEAMETHSSEPVADVGIGDEEQLSAEDEAYAEELARRAAEAEDIDDAGDEQRDEGDNYTEAFKPASAVQGEILLNVTEISDWDLHPKRFSPLKGPHASALALTAATDPLAFRPLVVIEKDGKYVVVDGRFILEAIRSAHKDVMVRAVLFDGTEEEAVASVADAGLGSVGMTKMEQAHAVLGLQRTNRVSQRAIAERYPNLTDSKVSNMAIAARMQDAHPALFEVLEEPHKVPISYGVELNKAVKRMSPTELQDLLNLALQLDDQGQRFSPGEALEIFGIKAAAITATGLPVVSGPMVEDIIGDDDQPVGLAELMDDGVERLSLPSSAIVGDMSLAARQVAAEKFILRIRRHFGLDQA